MDETSSRIKELLKILRLCLMEKALDQELTRAAQEASPVSEVILRLLWALIIGLFDFAVAECVRFWLAFRGSVVQG